MRGAVVLAAFALVSLLFPQNPNSVKAETDAPQATATAFDVPSEAVSDEYDPREAFARIKHRREGAHSADAAAVGLGDSEHRNVELLGRWAEGTPNDMVARGKILYLAEGGQVKIVDFSEPLRPKVIGKILVPTVAMAVALDGDHLFVLDEVKGLRVIDVADPANPVEEGSCDFMTRRRSSWNYPSYSFAVGGGRACAAVPGDSNQPARLTILDVTDPRAPREIGVFAIEARDLAVCGDLAYIASPSEGLVIVDLTDPTGSRVVGRYDDPRFYPDGISVDGSLAYVVSSYEREILIFDVSRPTAPAVVGHIDRRPGEIEVRDGLLYALDAYWGGLGIYDISNPTAPVELSRVSKVRGERFALSDDLAFVGGSRYSPSVIAVDISRPANARAVGRFDTGFRPTSAAVDGDFLYVTDEVAGLRILDVRDPAAMVEAGRFKTPWGAQCVAVRDGICYLGASSVFHLLDVSDPTRPVELGAIDFHPYHWGDSQWLTNIALHGQYAYASTMDEGGSTMVRIIDVSAPEAPRGVGRIWQSYMASGGRIGFHDGVALVPGHRPGVEFFDVSVPEHPNLIGSWGPDTGAGSVAVSDGIAFVTRDEQQGISILDLSDLANPVEIGRWDSRSYLRNIEVSGQYLHVTSWYDGYEVFDISDPTTPISVASFSGGVLPTALAVDSERVFVTDEFGGVYALSFVPTVAARVDVVLGECPNLVKLPSGKSDAPGYAKDAGDGLFTVAIYDTPTLSADQVDPSTVRLCDCRPKPQYRFRDVGSATPPAVDTDCADGPPDGRPDLVLHFDRSELMARLGPTYDGATHDLTLTGSLFDGRRVIGYDRIRIVVSRDENQSGSKWAYRFGDAERQWVECVAVDGRENVLVTGYFRGILDFGGGPLENFGPDDAFIAKLDRHGRHVWSRSFCDTRQNDPAGKAVAADDSGNVFLAGDFYGRISLGGDTLSGPEDQGKIFVAKFGPLGTHMWSRKVGWLGSQMTAGLAVDPSGGVVIAGSSTASNSSQIDYALVNRFDANGQQLWYLPLTGPGKVRATAVAVDGAGNTVVAGWLSGSADFGGRTLTSVSSMDIFLVKLDPEGRHIWGKILESGDYSSAAGVAIDRQNRITIAGHFNGSIDFGGGVVQSRGWRDLFIATFSPQGHLLWGKGIGSTDSESATAVAVDRAGSFYVTGEFDGVLDFGTGPLHSAGGSDVFVAVFDEDGRATWSERYGDAEESQVGQSITVDDVGRAVVAGDFFGSVDFGTGPLASAGHSDIFLAKLGSVNTPSLALASEGAEPAPVYSLQLHQNYPNPFNPTTTIPVEIPERTFVNIAIFDVSGRLTRTLVNEVVESGPREVYWDGRDSRGESVSSGVYFTRLSTGGRVLTKKLVLLK